MAVASSTSWGSVNSARRAVKSASSTEAGVRVIASARRRTTFSLGEKASLSPRRGRVDSKRAASHHRDLHLGELLEDGGDGAGAGVDGVHPPAGEEGRCVVGGETLRLGDESDGLAKGAIEQLR
jgi:hypothetical protein